MKEIKIAYLGPEKTFTEKAAREFFKNHHNAEFIPFQPIRNVIMAVENGKVDFGVVPLENFYNGEVRETLDSLNECSKTKIVSERALEIIYCLGALKNHTKIKKILSKDQALEQCGKYLCLHLAEATTIATTSTMQAAENIKSANMLDAAAIASRPAIESAGLKILAKDICPNNKTRFVLIAKKPTMPTGDDKTFISIHPPIRDKPGVLYNSLGFFANFGINLEDLKSRPDGKKGYYFYIELDGHEADKKVIMALDAIKFYLDPENKHPNTIKILGSYKNAHWKDED